MCGIDGSGAGKVRHKVVMRMAAVAHNRSHVATPPEAMSDLQVSPTLRYSTIDCGQPYRADPLVPLARAKTCTQCTSIPCALPEQRASLQKGGMRHMDGGADPRSNLGKTDKPHEASSNRNRAAASPPLQPATTPSPRATSKAGRTTRPADAACMT